MQPQYQPTDVEARARQHWAAHNSFRAVEDSAVPLDKRFYCLSMFPYPSGKLHMGHVRNYTIGDVLTRWHKARGFNVLQPMGWDAFGLPAENAAIRNKVPPAQWTYSNIAHMKGQLQALGLAIDWEREFATCQPDYYRWNQWLFLRMLERGIAYKQTQVVNWDPVDQTVLANEQVIDGRGWRTGALVEKREIPGYYLGITQYAEELLASLDTLAGWPERVRTMQANWIGKSVGVRFAFAHNVRGADGALVGDGRLWVFTTRADTLMGVTFCAVAAEHPLALRAADLDPGVATFVDECRKGTQQEAELATQEKTGVPTGFHAVHPVTGEQVPVWVGNYVLMGYGEGAVMAVPAHDERDFGFARKYGLPIKQVIDVGGQAFSDAKWNDWYASKDGRCIHSGPYDGKGYREAVDAIAADLAAKSIGEKKTQWRLRDWGISRQRYWGCPIPIIHCPSCGDVPVPDEQLPVVLPEDCVPDGSGNPLRARPDFLHCACPRCGGAAQRETDTMDTFVDSSWYFARYCARDNDSAMVDARADYWMPVQQYIGGIEHAILHLLYSRFWNKVMCDVGLLRAREPFAHLLTQGMVLNHIFSRRTDKGSIEYFAPEEIDLLRDDAGRCTGATLKADGSAVGYDGIGTMSKSKRNGVDPQGLIDNYGADTARFFMMFASPPEQTLEWSDAGVEGAYRFLKRVWAYGAASADAIKAAGPLPAAFDGALADARRDIHLTLKQCNFDLGRQQFNTVASGCMKLLNALEKLPRGSAASDAVAREGFGILLQVLAPITPHITQTLWADLGYGDDILSAGWPEPEVDALMQDEIELVLQVNGKPRGSLRIAADASRDVIEQVTLASEVVARYLEGRPPKKVIVVPGRLVNVVG
jgi:leucyl-tRNA synthetase